MLHVRKATVPEMKQPRIYELLGVDTSFALIVNYLNKLSNIEKNHEEFVESAPSSIHHK